MHLLVTVFNKICLHSQFVSRIVMASICLVLLTVVIVGQILADGQADGKCFTVILIDDFNAL